MAGEVDRSKAGPYLLVGPDGRNAPSVMAGILGGHRRSRIYGRLDCRAARRALARGGYVANRVFFASAEDAEAAGYRPCGVCLPEAYRAWREVARSRSAMGAG